MRIVQKASSPSPQPSPAKERAFLVTSVCIPPQTSSRQGEGVVGNDRAALVWLWSFVRTELRRLGFVLLFSLLATTLALSQPYLTKWLIDDGLLAGSLATVLGCVG
ncbi:MAG: hypothetical protein R3F37_15385 [Candidatus Competibacteraceae bacterium]